MATVQRTGIADFYERDVLPALTQNLDHAFPEFGWQRDTQGWRAANQEFTHSTLGVRADRVVCHGDAPRGFLVHGQGPARSTGPRASRAAPRACPGRDWRVDTRSLDPRQWERPALPRAELAGGRRRAVGSGR
jgi:hypothetical protein